MSRSHNNNTIVMFSKQRLSYLINVSRISCCIPPSPMNGFLYNLCRWLLLQKEILYLTSFLALGIAATQGGGLTQSGWVLLSWQGYPEIVWVLEEGARVFFFFVFVFLQGSTMQVVQIHFMRNIILGGYHTVCFHHEMGLTQQENPTRILWPYSMVNVMPPQNVKLTFSFSREKALKTRLVSFITDKVKYILHLIFTKIVISIFVFTILLLRVKHFLIMHP